MIRRWLLMFLVLSLAAAGCGASDSTDNDDDAASSSEAVAAPTATLPPTAAPEPEPTAAPEPEPEPDPIAAPEPEPESEPEPQPEPEPEPATEPYDAPGDLEVPAPLPPGQPGDVIDTEELTIAGAVGQRILYHSTSTAGDDIAVSGFVRYPDGEPPADGWPLIAWAHGTTGLGDTCAPSINAETDQLALALNSFGYAVVATDYEGMGTPGLHPYVVGASEAHSVLDSVRAVQNLDLPVTDRWVAFGHSQGGHAAMFTGQLQPSYAPELNMIGVVAGAPPSQMGELGDSLVGGDFQGYLVMTAAGLVAADPSLDLGQVLSADAIDLIDVVETGCTAEIFEIYNPLDYDEVSQVDDPFELDDWGAALRANDTNQLPVEAPLFIIHGGEDEQIPVDTSATLFSQLCDFAEQGPTVRTVYPGQSHAGVLTSGAAVPDLLSWVQGRFADDPAPNDCP